MNRWPITSPAILAAFVLRIAVLPVLHDWEGHEETEECTVCDSANGDSEELFCGLGGDCGNPDHHHHDGNSHGHDPTTCDLCQTLLRLQKANLNEGSSPLAAIAVRNEHPADVDSFFPWLLVGSLSARGPPV
ncbi:MAG: hypothetical protein O3B01_27620 [Planctomycetota bacterium]|nr:hypothetical protein [Planctomycetota bacterium]